MSFFPLYSVPDSKILRKVYFDCFFFIRKTLYSEVGKVSEKNLFLRTVYSILYRIPKKSVFDFVNRILYKKPSRLVNLLFIPTKSSKYGIPRRCVEENTELVFETKSFSAMKGYDEVLRIAYGDYMQFPPVEKRASHNPASKIVFPDGTVIEQEEEYK